MSEPATAPRGSSTRIVYWITFLNLALLGWLLYTNFGPAFSPGGGTSMVIINDTLTPMLDVTLAYPGGEFSVPRLSSGQSVGNPARFPGAFDAKLTFKDESGRAFEETFKVKPVGDLLLLVYVQPMLEPVEPEPAAGAEPPAAGPRLLKASPDRVRILLSFQGENTNI